MSSIHHFATNGHPAPDRHPLGLRRLTRRSVFGLALGGAVAVTAGLSTQALAQENEVAVEATGVVVQTTAPVNLRSGPGTNYGVILVVPEGAGLGSNLTITDGFQNVTYNGTRGWVSRDYLVDVVADPGSSRPDPETQYTGRATIETAVNFRAGASTSAPIDLTMAAGTVVETSGLLANGFRACRLNGQTGWVIDGALVPVSGGATPPPPAGQAGYTNTDVNFRMEPTYGNNVIRVLPANTVVTVTGEASGEFIRVTTPGDIGWVFGAYVSFGTPGGSPGGGTNPPSDGSDGLVTTALNLREQPSTSAAILAVMPAGVSITVTGAVTVGFLPIIYNGTSGWAAADYIRSGANVDWRTTTDVNLRESPSLSSRILTVLPAGAGLSYAGTGNAPVTGWSGPFDYGNLRGYVASDYVVAL